MHAVVILCLCALVCVSAWAPSHSITRSRRGSLSPLRSDEADDAPSDTGDTLEAEYDAIEFESPPKAFLLGDSSTMTRSEVNEYVLALETVLELGADAPAEFLNCTPLATR